jgi:hypothetical protein
MIRAPIKGWIRLGIVLSSAWVVAVLAYAIFDFYTFNSKEAGWESAPKASATAPVIPVREINSVSLLTECGHDGKHVETSCWPRYGSVTLLVFAPIAAGWIIVLVTVLAVLWIRAGFREKET